MSLIHTICLVSLCGIQFMIFLSYFSLVKFCPNWNTSIKKAGTYALLCVITSLLLSRVLDHSGLHKYLMNEWMVDE